MATMTTLVDNTIPVAADFNGNFTALNNAIGSSTTISSYTTGDIVYSSATNTLSKLGIGDQGQGLVVSTSDIPAWGTLAGHLWGLGLSQDVDTDHDTLIAVGEAASDDATIVGRTVMRLGTAITKRIDASWAVGDDQGGLDGTETVAGTPDTSTWYHVWLIMRSDTGVVDALYSESATAPTMPTNYDYKRRIGAVLTDGSANITAYFQVGDFFGWDDPPLDINDDNPGTAAVTRTLTVPTGVTVDALFNVWVEDSSPTLAVVGYITNLNVNDEGPVASGSPGFQFSKETGATRGGTQLRVGTNTSGQVRSRLSASDADIDILMVTMGWYDRRGRDS